MKSLKVAAVLAGSLIATGVAAPAFAAGATDSVPTGLSGAIDTTAPLDVTRLQHERDVLGIEGKDSLVHTAKEAATAVKDTKPVHGGLVL
ncbi:hypothetical protein ABZ079_00655 [Streptomyces sp. NPDC006314]|uniref:hypothetical protein n=1 Tax=Streptomyces sp. NPDC006314 TaxID=3154475 RepID=UPI0033A8949A